MGLYRNICNGSVFLRSWVASATLLLAVLAAGAQAQVRVMTYNLLNYPGSTAAVRDPAFRMIITAADPHMIVAQEVPDLSNADAFLNNVLNVVHPGQWSRGPYFDGPDTNNALFYRASRVVYVSGDSDSFVRLTTSLRDINRWKLRPAGYASQAATFFIYSAHLASSGGETARAAEAAILRNNANTLPAGARFLVAGDFNLTSTSEGAYQRFTESQSDDDGRCRDPLNPSNSQQTWNNNSAFRFIHTQSTRTGTLNPSDGGATGGLDDRFDFILMSYQMYQTNPLGQGLCYIPNSTTAFGNDGNHFNLNINDPPTNPAIGQDVADALQRASDHLPVLVSLQVPARGANNGPLDFGRVITGGSQSRTLTVTNVAQTDAANGADSLIYTLAAPNGFSAPTTQFTEPPLGGSNSHTITMNVTAIGPVAAQLVINSNDPESPAANVGLSGLVLRHAAPSLLPGTQTLTGSRDFGEHRPGEFAPQTVALYNAGFDSNQALLDWYNSTLTGTHASRFSITQRSDPMLVGGSPGSVSVSFNASGAAPFTDYVAELRFLSRDEALPGGGGQPDVVVSLHARVAAMRGDLNLDGRIDAADAPLFERVLLGLDADPTRVSLADMNGDGAADGADLQAFILALGL